MVNGHDFSRREYAMRIQSPKKRIIHKDRKTVTQTWGEKRRSAYVENKVERETTGKKRRCESTELSPLANRLHDALTRTFNQSHEKR